MTIEECLHNAYELVNSGNPVYIYAFNGNRGEKVILTIYKGPRNKNSILGAVKVARQNMDIVFAVVDTFTKDSGFMIGIDLECGEEVCIHNVHRAK